MKKIELKANNLLIEKQYFVCLFIFILLCVYSKLCDAILKVIDIKFGIKYREKASQALEDIITG